MKTKLLPLFLLSVILILAAVSAATFAISSPTPSPLSKASTDTSLIVTNRGPETINLQVILPATIDDGKGHSIIITSLSTLTFNNLATNQNTGAINITYSGDLTNFKIGEFTSNIIINAAQAGNSTNSLSQQVPLKFLNTFCKLKENTTTGLSISSVDISNADGDDTEWGPLDEITIKVKVENTGTERISGVDFEIGLYDSNGKNVIKNMDNLNNKKIDIGTVNEDKEKTGQFTFKIPADFDEDNYLLVVKAYKSGKEAELCTSFSSDFDSGYFQTISGIRETDSEKQVVVTNIITSPEETAKCSDRVQISADVVNIGDEDFNDQFKVTLYNKELGVNLQKTITEDLNSGDSKNVDFEFDVPKNITEKSYDLEFRTYYDYDEGDSYNEVSDEKFIKTIKILGNCNVGPSATGSKLQITAELDPETPDAIAGKQVVITSTLKNIGDTETKYSISVYGNSAWSNVVSINPQTVTLSPGESSDVSIVLAVDNEAQGDKEFSIRAAYGPANEKAFEQKVALTITASQAQFGSIQDHLKRNWFIYLIIIVNIILIIAIIMVIRRMISPRRDYE